MGLGDVVGVALDEPSGIVVACQYPIGQGDSHCLSSSGAFRLLAYDAASSGGGTHDPSVGQPVQLGTDGAEFMVGLALSAEVATAHGDTLWAAATAHVLAFSRYRT